MRANPFLLAGLALGLGVSAAIADTVTLSGSFNGSIFDPGWTVGGSGFTPVLTASSAGGNIDTAGNGWLRLTSAAGNQATYAYNANAFVSKDATIAAAFDYVSYGGNGADGITFFLADASKTFGVGAYGGSLGYAQKTAAGGGGADIVGMNGGYIGLGIDEFGNFANATEGRVGGLGATPDAVSVRGPGQGLTGYEYLGGTGTLPISLDTPGAGVRPTVTTYQIIITATNQLTVYMDRGATGTLTSLYNIDLSGYSRPDSLIMGFTGSTGGSTNIHEVRTVALASVVADIWTNAAGDSNWGTNNSWYGDPSGQVPANFADVLLTNTYVSTAQAVNVGTNRIVRSLQIDAPFAYTLNNGSLTFDSGGILGPSGIFVSKTNGSATQTINPPLALNNAIQIQNNSTGALVLNGTIATNGKAVDVNGTGSTSATGVISGTGAIRQTGTGTTTFSGANTYTGATTITAGTLNANNATALGTSAVTLAGGTLGSTNASTIGNAVALTGNAGLSGITTSGTLTQTGGSYTVNMADATQSGAVNLSNTTTTRTLTVQVDSGTSTVSGVIANGAGSTGGNLTKTGGGTLTLSGANTYTGTTNLSAGTVQLGANNVLADTSSLDIAGGTLNLAGYSDKVGVLKFSAGATLDFGTAAGNNSFVFSNLDAASTGVLTVNNYIGPDSTNFNGTGDFLGTTTASLGAALLNQIYFAGYGSGSLENSVLTAAGNGLGNAYRIAPNAAIYTVWDGLRDNGTITPDANWNTARNWVGDSTPTFNTTTRLSFGTATVPADRQTADMNGNRTVNAIRFENVNTAFTLTGVNGTNDETLTFAGTLPSLIQRSASNQALTMDRISWSTNGVIDTSGAGTLTLGNGITGDGQLYGTGSITKLGTGGRLILNADNSNWTGALTISQGIVEARYSGNALGSTSAATTVAVDAALQLNTGGLTFGETLTLSGTGTDGTGALRNIATNGTNTVSGGITLGGNTTITADSGGTLALSGGIGGTNRTLTLGGAGNVTVSSAIATGTGEVVVAGAGTTTFSGGAANTYTGVTTVNAGTLALSKTANVTAIAGNLVINGGTVNQTTSGQILATKGITLNTGAYTLSDGAGTSIAQTLQSLNTSSGTTVNLGAADTLTISGTGVSTLSGLVAGAGGLATAGAGTVYLGAANTYSGGTTIGGIVTAANSASLGTGAVTVSNGGNLQVQAGITLANNFTLSGPGTNANDGAIENFSGNNTVSGNIALGSAARIQSSAGTLTVSNAGTLTGTGNALTVGGAGNTIVNRGINTSTGGTLTKDGSGTLTLGAASNYTGATALNAGTTQLGVANAFSSSSAITVATGAVLDLNGYAQSITNLQGGGGTAGGSITFAGATLTLAGGASSFGGDFGFSNGTIVINAGQSLTLTDSFNAANINIVLNGGSLFLGNGLTQTFGSLIVNGATASVIDFGTSGATVAQFSSVNVTGAGNLSVNNWTDMVDYFLSTTTSGAQGTSPTNKVVFAGYSGNATKWLPFGGGNGQLTPVPEPSTYGAIMLGGAAGLLVLRRRRRASK